MKHDTWDAVIWLTVGLGGLLGAGMQKLTGGWAIVGTFGVVTMLALFKVARAVRRST